jgi:MFS family permease
VRRPYGWFLAGASSWSLAFGLNQVVFSWLLVGELHEDASRVGFAQMCLVLPSLLFLLPGGLLADRSDLRRVTLGVQAAAALCSAALAAAVGLGALSLPLLAVYALVWGTIQAMNGPARDALLSHVARGDLLRAITGLTVAQFAANAAGSRLGGVAEHFGSAQMLLVQAGILAVGVSLATRLPRVRPASGSAARPPALAALSDGLRIVRASPRLLPVALLVAANGTFYMGPFQVLCPLIVRDVYGGDVGTLASAMMMLPLGCIAASLAILWRGGLERKGAAVLAALFGVALVLVGFGLRLPFPAFAAGIFLWGACHALFVNASRTLFQQAAPPSHRAQVLAVYSLGLLGMAPLSSLASGLLAARFGLLAACAIPGVAMVGIVAWAWFASGVRRFS